MHAKVKSREERGMGGERWPVTAGDDECVFLYPMHLVRTRRRGLRHSARGSVCTKNGRHMETASTCATGTFYK